MSSYLIIGIVLDNMGVNIYLAVYFGILNNYRFIVVLSFLCPAQSSPLLKLSLWTGKQP